MKLRSLLFVPGDRPDRMDKARDAGADAVILDLEDAVAPSRKNEARSNVAAFIGQDDKRVRLLVRINALHTADVDADLKALEKTPPDGYVLPKSEGGDSIAGLLRRLDAMGCARRPVLAIAAETAASVFTLAQYREVAGELIGLTWGVEDLRAAVGASRARTAEGGFTPPFEMVRSLTLFAAHAAGTAAIESVYPEFRDAEGLSRHAGRAARDGFSGMLAIHPVQVPLINQAFTPSTAEIERARRIVAAFRDHAGEGAVGLDGSMLDAAHLRQAQLLIARAAD
jgi:citrate lyase subunit beta/citryl-CoA lyase